MLGVLVKKQLMEIFRAYFYNERKGVKRSVAGTVGMFAIFALAMIIFIGGLFTGASLALALILQPMQLDWLYFSAVGLLAIFIGVLGSVFSTYSTLYLSKDNEMLFSLPLSASDIIFSRLIAVLVIISIYTLLVWIPGQIIYFFVFGFQVNVLLTSILSGILILLMVMILTCLLGMLVAKVSVRLKNKSFVTVIISLAFMALYYLFYFNANTLLTNVGKDILANTQQITTYAFPVYAFGAGCTGNWILECGTALVVLLLALLVWKALKSSFFSLASSSKAVSSVSKKVKKEKVTSLKQALFYREWKHFTSNATYMLNTGLGCILLPFTAIFFVWKTNEALSLMNLGTLVSTTTICALFVLGICIIAGMNDITAPSISLEGKNMWQIRSLPVDTWEVLKAKIQLHVVVTGVPALIAVICGLWFVHFDFVMSIFMIVLPFIYILFTAMFGLVLNLCMPNFTWSNETTPIKQAVNVLITLLVNMAIPVIAIILMIVLQVNTVLYLSLFTAICLLGNIFLVLWLKKQGVEIFERFN